MLGTLQHTRDSLIPENHAALQINLQTTIALIQEKFPPSKDDLIAFLSSDPGADAYETALKILLASLGEDATQNAEDILQFISTYGELDRAELQLPTVADVAAYYEKIGITVDALQQANPMQTGTSES